MENRIKTNTNKDKVQNIEKLYQIAREATNNFLIIEKLYKEMNQIAREATNNFLICDEALTLASTMLYKQNPRKYKSVSNCKNAIIDQVIAFHQNSFSTTGIH